jgi:hypothetical protein
MILTFQPPLCYKAPVVGLVSQAYYYRSMVHLIQRSHRPSGDRWQLMRSFPHTRHQPARVALVHVERRGPDCFLIVQDVLEKLSFKDLVPFS